MTDCSLFEPIACAWRCAGGDGFTLSNRPDTSVADGGPPDKTIPLTGLYLSQVGQGRPIKGRPAAILEGGHAHGTVGTTTAPSDRRGRRAAHDRLGQRRLRWYDRVGRTGRAIHGQPRGARAGRRATVQRAVPDHG